MTIRKKVSDLFLKALEGHRQWLCVKTVCERLNSAGFDAVLAGGCVRDGFLGISPKDFDVATNAKPDEVETLFERTISVGKNFGVIVVPLESGGTIEVATFRKDEAYVDGRRPTAVVFSDREEDAKRRDFTINALFYDPLSREIIDCVGGLEDIRNRLIRTVGDPKDRFREDKLRLLRAVRFSGQLNFSIDASTEAALRLYAPELRAVSRERVRDEVDKLLSSEWSARGFAAMAQSGLAEAVFQDWAGLIAPVPDREFSKCSLDVARLLLYYPALGKMTPDRIQERLRDWKYGRAFIELAVWFVKNETSLRSPGPDPVQRLLSRQLLLQKFEVSKLETNENPEIRLYSEVERQWMDTLELWTDPRAIHAVQALDVLKGADSVRGRALSRRGLELGAPDPMRAKAEDVLIKEAGLQGPRLGRELRRLNREILLRL